MKLIPIDFEYNTTQERDLNLICCSLEINGEKESHWLYQDAGAKLKLKERLIKLRDSKDYAFLCFNGDAEGSSFISLGLNPTKFKWVDLQNEWKMIKNKNDKFAYGRQLIAGREVITYAPDPYAKEEDGKNHSNPPVNLAGCLFKLLGKKIDTIHKNKMRDICIRNNTKEITDNKKTIIEYCESDISYLKPAFSEIKKFYIAVNTYSTKELLFRGETSARVALMSRTGYPIKRDWTENIYKNSTLIVEECQRDINSQFPDTPMFIPRFKTKPERGMRLNTTSVHNYIEMSENKDTWPRSEKTGKYMLADKVYSKYWSFENYNYPREDFGAQFVRFKKLISSLSGFRITQTSKTKPFHTIVGSDDRARPWHNPYGSSTGRFQASASGFIFHKAAWMRIMVLPNPGRALVGIDYSSQEFLICALLSEDRNMIDAYKSGDPYLYFAKKAGAIPPEGRKKDYKDLRNKFKQATLAMGYGQGAKGMGEYLTQKLNKKVTTEEARELIDLYYETYPDYKKFTQAVRHEYQCMNMLRLPDGWTMYGDNPNALSVGNFLVQGMGGCILRKAIQLCQDAGISVVFPHHDALYLEIPSSDLSKVDLILKCMRDAFIFYFEGLMKKEAGFIRSDIDIWGPDFIKGQEIITPKGLELTAKKVYIDGRAGAELQVFKKYLTSKNY